MAEIDRKSLISFLDTARKGVPPEEIMEAMGHIDDYPSLIGQIAALEREGEVVVGRKGRVMSARVAGLIPADILSVSRAFAFARREDGEDIYISDAHLSGAMLHDRVLLSLLPDRGKGAAGKVEKILTKGKRDYTGTLGRYRGVYEITADERIQYVLPVEKKKLHGAKVGDKILFELCFDRRSGDWYAVIKKVYGKAESARVCADAILDAQGIPANFPSDVILEAKRISQRGVREQDLSGRLDLRDSAVFTIDGSDAKDLDDAISVEKTDDGYTLGVHIADVSHYVRADGLLDREARQRGTSVYFADRVIPMLPAALSNGICSLNAGEDKLTFSCIMQMNGDGKILSYAFYKSVIHSKIRGVYSEINALFDGTADEKTEQKYRAVRDHLDAAKALYERMKARAVRRGAMNLDSRESIFILNEEGVCVDLLPRTRGISEEMIEHFMIAANQSAAELARTTETPFVYRVHEQPDLEKLEVLSTLAGALGFETRRLREGVRSADFAKLLNSAQATKYGRIISNQILRSMAKARYDPRPIGHFGLSLSDYCHFTSPIRRYPDLAIHRVMTALLEGKRSDALTERFGEFVVEAARQSSVCELRAQRGERMAEDIYMAEYMTTHIGEEYDAIISGVTQRGLFVELQGGVEGFVSLSDFPKGQYSFDNLTAYTDKNTGAQLAIGGEVHVQCVASDIPSARIDFVIL